MITAVSGLKGAVGAGFAKQSRNATHCPVMYREPNYRIIAQRKQCKALRFAELRLVTF
jgi:hypothetical protein